jgi:hypothetical protein
MAVLTRADVLLAIRVGKLLDKATDPGATVQEAASYEAMARMFARRHPGALIYDGKPVLEEDGHDEAGSAGRGDDEPAI